jgi:hypothetical protein
MDHESQQRQKYSHADNPTLLPDTPSSLTKDFKKGTGIVPF